VQDYVQGHTVSAPPKELKVYHLLRTFPQMTLDDILNGDPVMIEKLLRITTMAAQVEAVLNRPERQRR